MRFILSAMPLILSALVVAFPGAVLHAPMVVLLLGGVLTVCHIFGIGMLISAVKTKTWIAIVQRHAEIKKEQG